MKAVLYAVIRQQEWNWHVSVEMNADLAVGFERWGGQAEVLLLEPFISYGQAATMQKKLHKQARSYKDKHSLLRTMQDMARRQAVPERVVQAMSLRILRCGPGSSIPPSIKTELEAFRRCMQGRSLLYDEIVQLLQHYGLRGLEANPLYYVQFGLLEGWLEFNSGVCTSQRPWWKRAARGSSQMCTRCGSGDKLFYTECVYCRALCPYCEQCLNMGRTRYCSPLISGTADGICRQPADERDLAVYTLPWGLSEIQSEASMEALRFLAQPAGPKPGMEPRRFLIWAVTGAGKTEMIFPMIAFELARGGRVLVTTPRKDVVLELQPRLSKAFEDRKVVTLYGGSNERWEMGQLTIATTHQLLRFAAAFDLIVIDEIDAFPYHNNPMLEYAARRALAPGGAYIYLSATPPDFLQKAVRRRSLPCARVPARFHRHPLPVPRMVATPSLAQLLKQRSIPGPLLSILKASIERGAQLFIFVPKIQMVEPLAALLRASFPQLPIEGTSSQDEMRTEKVRQFRGTDIRMLVTTTILERGVTIPKSDVVIMDADAPIFDAAALVQMAGRAGRSKDDPAGKVYFARKDKTTAQAKAIGQIKDMNKLALKKGYLRHPDAEKGAKL